MWHRNKTLAHDNGDLDLVNMALSTHSQPKGGTVANTETGKSKFGREIMMLSK